VIDRHDETPPKPPAVLAVHRVGRLLSGPAPAGLAPYRRILDALGLRADDVLLEIGPGGGNFLARAARAGRERPQRP